ncbi:hypothetical protein EJ04DRAFT_588850 [Polyplosphaeria fusca]|uniref:BZIP domain-containing protein n=1 Tax=Polyplosphaeria fusca TaxID=682080 RepID=A0A9P4R270_9PLEO|nr:hypothetical protein EJ04DRAFT_588850 [Polyplosphaeria fusca]
MYDAEEWRDITNSRDRKKMQNRLAQRRRRMRERIKTTGGASGENSIHARTTSLDSATTTVEDAEPLSPLNRSSNVSVPQELNLDLFVDPSFPEGTSIGTSDPWENFAEHPAGDFNLDESLDYMASAKSPGIQCAPLAPLNESTCPSLQRAQQGIPRLEGTFSNKSNHSKDINDYCVRFTHIFRAMDAAGFTTFDQMATEYYTAEFTPSSAAYNIQRQSRLRHLRHFLADVDSAARSWGIRERRGWAEEIVHAAEDIHIEEYRVVMKNLRSGALHVIPNDLHDMAAQKSFFQEQLPDLWALFSRIVDASGLEQSQSSRKVLSAMQLLLGYSHAP